MFWFPKKTIIFIISFIVGIIIFMCSIYKKDERNTTKTVSALVKDKVIILDAGHGIPDE